MPVPLAAKVGIIALTVAVTAAVAVYESPELRRMAEDLRRRIAMALHAFGDRISPQEREHLFNRPEDAEGFLRSRGMLADEHGVDADEETRRRQREELMYWNSLREEKKRGQQSEDPEKTELRRRSSTRGSSFDDFMKPADNAEKGTFVFQTGSEPQNNSGLFRRRGDGARGLNPPAYTNPFTDEHGIDDDIAFENSLMDPEKDEIMSDIYSATDVGKEEPSRTATLSPISAAPATASAATLVDVNVPAPPTEQPQDSESELGQDEYMTAGQEDREGAYSSIQAWAEQSSANPSFYSPLPVSPAAPLSEPELISDDGVMTPTDTASLAGSGEDIADEARSMRSGSRGGYYDVMSEDEGMMTPASWTEVGSVVSESDSGEAVHA
ncbi:hypothetical protein F5X96DRAFT_634471 [Biscogniauxia mediterranea]|nr:hypothetical protein F5X96DRAFT_634471 [Biscogniauxia mediterranea]